MISFSAYICKKGISVGNKYGTAHLSSIRMLLLPSDDHSNRVASFTKNDLLDRQLRFHVQVLPFAQNGPQISSRRAPTHSVLYGAVHDAESFLLESVHVVGAAVTGLDAGVDERVVQRVDGAISVHVQRAVGAPILVSAATVGLRLLKIWQTVGVGPSGTIFFLGPTIVVERMASNVAHGVERGRSSQNASAGPIHHSVVHVHLGLSMVIPKKETNKISTEDQKTKN